MEVEVEVVLLEISEDGTMNEIIDHEVAVITATTIMGTVDEIIMTTIVVVEEEIMVTIMTVAMAMVTGLATETITTTAAVVAAGILAIDTTIIEDTTEVGDVTTITIMIVVVDHQHQHQLGMEAIVTETGTEICH